MFTTEDILEIAVQVEANGEQTYRKAAREVADPSLAEQLAALADDEQKHRRWFLDLKGRLAVQSLDPEAAALGREMFSGILGEKAFSLDEADLSRLPDMRALLEVSAELERDTITFYEILEPFMEDEQARQDLKVVIEEERTHLRLLQERLAEIIISGRS